MSIRNVFRHSDINQLTDEAYKLISLHMGFIAHYDLYGFRAVYSNTAEFARKLLTGELTKDTKWNDRNADHIARDYAKEEGRQEYGERTAQAMRCILRAARQYLKGTLQPETSG